jgi:hypothetical protein
MPDLTTLTPQQQTLSRKVNVRVLSRADPDSGVLRRVREKIQQNSNLSNLFANRNVDVSELTKLLTEELPLDEGVGEVAQYLADEYAQLGDGILMISTETGRAIAKLTEEDFYQPAAVPREDGRMVERPPAIKPEVESFISMWRFEDQFEQRVRERILSRITQTEGLREKGDPRLLATSRGGRRELAGRIEQSIPSLFENPKGVVGDFLQYFPIGTRPESEQGYTRIRVNPSSIHRKSTQDPLAINLKYDPVTATMAVIATSWVRVLASSILESRDLSPRLTPLEEAVRGRTDGLWIAEPNLATALQKNGCRTLAVPGPEYLAIHVLAPAGILEMPLLEFGIHSREMHGRWTVEAVTEATLWLTLGTISTFRIEDINPSGVSVEVLS